MDLKKTQIMTLLQKKPTLWKLYTKLNVVGNPLICFLALKNMIDLMKET